MSVENVFRAVNCRNHRKSKLLEESTHMPYLTKGRDRLADSGCGTAVGAAGTTQYRQGFARHPAADCGGTAAPGGRDAYTGSQTDPPFH